MVRFAWLVPTALFVAAATAPCAAPAGPDPKLIALGRAIAEKNCSRCHAIGETGASANPKSPPFRTLSSRYPLADLEEALAEGIMVGHEGLEMPQFQLDAGQIEALLAYLSSVQAK
jgi:cytochrome c